MKGCGKRGRFHHAPSVTPSTDCLRREGACRFDFSWSCWAYTSHASAEYELLTSSISLARNLTQRSLSWLRDMSANWRQLRPVSPISHLDISTDQKLISNGRTSPVAIKENF